MFPAEVPALLLGSTCSDPSGTLVEAVCTATGPPGLLIVLVYSFLITFILPLPSEIVLPLADQLRLGLPLWANLTVVVLVASIGKAGGSVFAFHIGQEAKESGPVIRWLRRSRFDVIEWSQTKVVQLSKKYGYAGLALALSVPAFPDTLSVYAFSVLEDDYLKFAAATFVGSVGRFLVWIVVVRGGVASL
ncbi:VTT domain-containing protein [Halosimplex rubrum]|uniref:VTT domain-containing protein n=1 Tax=Halosimplex rubrum TaxID=869889 RepID=A0A7D5P064_9EURY|nr:VTT domain-containing protein [Halosimplex rubrum]